MRLKDIIGLIIALLLALGVALLTRYFLTKEAPPKEQATSSVALVKIIVAGKELEVGSVINPGDLVWQDWPKNALNSTYVQEGMVTIESLNGFIVKDALNQGEPIHLEDVVDPKGKGFLAAIIAPGKRAYSIKITPETSSTGLIFPGDYVDVVVSKSQFVEGRNVSEGTTVVANVKVLAMGAEMATPQGTPKTPPTVATLEVTPQEADSIAAAEKEGTLSLSLHALSKGTGEEKVEQSNYSQEEKPKKTSITVVRGKEKTEVEVREP